ncbi:MAG: peptidylprolyl isomerase [Actinomycetia bacterium]|nr:peptidylprolyl isomerase [Actinomycetes bacterium]
MRTGKLPLMIITLALVAAACSTSTDSEMAADAATGSTTTSATTSTVPPGTVPSDYAGFLLQPTACGAQQPAPVVEMQYEAPDDAGIAAPTTVTLTTSCGEIEILLDPQVAPETVNSFVFLAESGYFDGSVSHRVVPGFMMQAGDPTATGLGGPGYSVPDEYPDESDYRRGVVAMANAGPGTTGSQFFILFEDSLWLPPTFSIFGEVTEGFDTLDLIQQIPLGRGPTSPDREPSTPVESLFIESVTVSG